MRKFYIFRSLKRGIKNLKNWFYIIWNDREWDYKYLENILLFKLKNMRDYYRAGVDVWSEGAEETADEINEVIELLEKVQRDGYEKDIDPHFYDWVYENFREWSEEETTHKKEVSMEAAKRSQADLDKAYGIIAKKIRGWWD